MLWAAPLSAAPLSAAPTHAPSAGKRKQSASGLASQPGGLVRSGFLRKRPVSKTGGTGWKRRFVQLHEAGVSWHEKPGAPQAAAARGGALSRLSLSDLRPSATYVQLTPVAGRPQSPTPRAL